MRGRTGAAAALLLALGGGPSPARAYEAVLVRDGGSLHGVVVFRGTAPAPALSKITRDEAVCGKQAGDQSLRVGKGGGLADVAVYLADIESGRAIDLAHAQKLDNVHCQFEPHLQTLSVGQTLVIRNSDPILHNTHASVLEGAGNIFNIALPTQGKEIRKVVAKPGVQQVKCDAGHTWMNAYFLVFEHPYHTVTDADGHFALQDIPAGSYTLRAWHERLGTVDAKVQVAGARDVEVQALVMQMQK